MITEFEPKRADFEQAVRTMFDGVPYRRIAGIELDEVKPGYVLGYMDRTNGLTQQNGFFHAGALAGLADSVAGLAAFSLMAEGEDVLSVHLAVSLMRPSDHDRVWAEGKPGKGATFSFTLAH